ncbi:MAG TPA: hypothetical protein VFR18_08180 [Terriglobia bacterium]|nr:hypothetical protein [Terriglobia bacterium]
MALTGGIAFAIFNNTVGGLVPVSFLMLLFVYLALRFGLLAWAVGFYVSGINLNLPLTLVLQS